MSKAVAKALVTVSLRKFDPTKITPGRTMVFLGKRGTGKTTLVTDILWYLKSIPVGVVMSGTEEGNHYYGQYFPDLFVYPEYKKDVVESITARQKQLCNNNTPNRDILLLLDDCAFDKSWTTDKCMRSIFMNGRHQATTLAVTLQYMMDLHPALRANIDYVFVLRENVIANKQRIYTNFFGVFPNFNVFSEVFDKFTENFECLVMDNTSKSNKIEDQVFYYKAEIRPPFRFGGDDYWSYHDKHYDPDHTDTQQDDGSMKRQSKVNVRVVRKG